MLTLGWSLRDGHIGALASVVCLVIGCGDSSPARPDDTESTGQTSTTTTASTTATTTTTTSGSETETEASGVDSSGSDTSDSTTTTGEEQMFCPDTHQCVGEAPEGWSGPGLLGLVDASVERVPECPAEYPDREFQAFDGLVADPAACNCTCGPANGASCQNSTTLHYWADNADCVTGGDLTLTVFGGACNNLPAQFPGNTYWLIEPVEAGGGACVPTTTEQIDDPTWTSQVIACDGADVIEDVCASGRVCVPLQEDKAFDGDVCIWRDGEHECPDGYDRASTVFNEVDDQRSCAACSCSDPAGICDDADVTMRAENNCVPPNAGTLPANGECQQTFAAQTSSVLFDPGEPSAFCNPSEPEPVGEAVGTDPTTVCCLG